MSILIQQRDTDDRGPSRQRRRDAFERSVAVLRAFRETATTEEMERIASRLEEVFLPVSPQQEHNDITDILATLTGEQALSGRTLSAQERLELETVSTARYFRRRQELLEDSLSAPQVAKLLGTTRQTPHDRAKAGSLLAVRERGGLRFPRWQFDPDGPDGVLAGLPDVVRALDVSALEKISWFVRPNPYLEERTPLEALKAAEKELLVSIARGVGVN